MVDLSLNTSWNATFLNLTPHKEQQIHVWNELSHLKPANDVPWMLMGDFNCILSLQEKSGGIQRTTKYMTQFMDFLNAMSLMSLPFTGNSFTWCNNQQHDCRIYERLDRAVVSSSRLTLYPLVSLNNLPIHHSDHGPICLALDQIPKQPKNLFRLEAMWLKHNDFINVVNRAITNPTVGSPIQKFHTFTSCFQALARSWNFNVFGNLFQQKGQLHNSIQALQHAYAQDNDPSHLESEKTLATQLHDLSLAEELFWHQRARTNWLALGDKNTSYFQTQALIRKKRK